VLKKQSEKQNYSVKATYNWTNWETELLHKGNLQTNKLKEKNTVEQYLKNQEPEKKELLYKGTLKIINLKNGITLYR
jgi:hypothetical protein